MREFVAWGYFDNGAVQAFTVEARTQKEAEITLLRHHPGARKVEF